MDDSETPVAKLEALSPVAPWLSLLVAAAAAAVTVAQWHATCRRTMRWGATLPVSLKLLPSMLVRPSQVRFITRPKSRTMRATRQLLLPPK